MTDQEKAPLIPNRAHHAVEKSRDQDIRWKHYTVIPIMGLVLVGGGFEFYSSLQWIQLYVKRASFPDTLNFTAFDGCMAKNHSDPDYIAYERVQSKSAEWQLHKSVAGCVPAVCASMMLPSYSDVLGRRFVFVIGITGLIIQHVTEACAIYFNLDLYVLVLASAVNGMFGGFYVLSSASYSYIADITRGGGRRTIGISSFDGFLLACSTVSGLSCGYLITYTGFFVPLATSTVLMILALLVTIFFLPETHKVENRLATVSVCKTIRRTFDFYGSSAFKGRRVAYVLLISAFFCQDIANMHRTSIEMLYQIGMPLCWTSEKVGIFSSIRHAAQAFAGIVLTAPLKVCLSDLAIATWSTLFNAGSFVMEGIVQTDLTMYLVSIPATLSFLTSPMIKSIMSILTPPDKQGSLFASVSVSENICGIAANFILNSTYAATVTFMQGFVFLVLAGFCMIVAVLLGVFGLTQKAVYSSAGHEDEINVQEDTESKISNNQDKIE